MPYEAYCLTPTGEGVPCCSFQNAHDIDNLIQPHNNKIFNLPVFQHLQDVMDEGDIPPYPYCNNCLKKEASGGKSYRMMYERNRQKIDVPFEKNVLRHLDISFSNTCNLSCIMCSNIFSSKWNSIQKLFPAELADKKGNMPGNFTHTLTKKQIDEILEKCDSLITCSIKGGEPLYDKKTLSNRKNLVMPYFMYPRIYNSFYKKINIINKPNFNLRIFFSGSIVEEGYGNFYWKKEPEKFPNRVETIKCILKEFKNEIFLINSINDLKTSQFNKKKIIFCLHDKVIKKTSYKLNFKDNFNLLSQSCFNLSCPGVVMPLCHHLIEGIKVGSIPITNCEKLLIPNLNKEISLNYSNLDELIEKFYEALNMENDRIVYMRSKVQNYYKANLSPEIFKQNFKKTILDKKNKIICCDDHRSVELI